jgi:uncharacterized membrane protein YphA (DoxX/SURF4 family)
MAHHSDKNRIGSHLLLAGRLFLALVFFAGASYNAFVTLRSPVTELGRLIDLCPAAFIRELAIRMAMPYPSVFTLIVILFEISVAVSALLGVTARRIAYIASLAFFVVLAPLIGWYSLPNLIWALPALLLFHYDRSDTPTSIAKTFA